MSERGLAALVGIPSAPVGPGGTIENSPAVHRLGAGLGSAFSPIGTVEVRTIVGVRQDRFSRPDGTQKLPCAPEVPALKGWAILIRPYGPGARAGLRSTGTGRQAASGTPAKLVPSLTISACFVIMGASSS